MQSSFLQCAHIILFSNSSLYFKIPKVFLFLFFTLYLVFFPSEFPKHCTAAADIYRSPFNWSDTQLACRTCGVEW